MSAASLRALLGDLSGAFADLGTFLSLVVAVLALRGFDASSILFGFGIFALATAAFYRLPIPVQPMKVVAAMIIVGALTPGQTAVVGILISLLLLVLVGSGLIGWIERLLPASVVLGVQLAFGVELAWLGLGQVIDAPAWGGAALVPLAAVGALLVFTGIELAISRRLLEMGRDNRVVAVGTAIACVLAGMAIGLVVGFVLERLRRVYLRRCANEPGPP